MPIILTMRWVGFFRVFVVTFPGLGGFIMRVIKGSDELVISVREATITE